MFPGTPALRNKGQQPAGVPTVGGEVELSRRCFWSQACGGTYPGDAVVGIDVVHASVGAREFCCSMGIGRDSQQAAEDLTRLTGLRVSAERLRQLTEGEGEAVARARRDGALAPSWSARDAGADPSRRARLYVGVDGVMVRTVTQQKKDKRRAGAGRPASAARTYRPGQHAAFVASPARQRPTLQGVQDRSVPDRSRTHVHAFATHEDHVALGRLVAEHAAAPGRVRADERLSLTDGVPWIRNQIIEHLRPLRAMLLGFYHLSEHVWSTARTRLGEGEAARAWVQEQLHVLKHVGPRTVLAAIEDLRKPVRSPPKLQRLRLLRQCIAERWEMVEYRDVLARGWDIGSGPTEAMGKNLTLRLKRPGMKWDADHAAAIMNLIALKESRRWADCWRNCKCA